MLISQIIMYIKIKYIVLFPCFPDLVAIISHRTANSERTNLALKEEIPGAVLYIRRCNRVYLGIISHIAR